MSRRRRWLEGLAVTVAALASIATSRKRWTAEAELPATPIKGPAVIVIESSRPAHMVLDDPAHHEHRAREHPATWPGTSRFLMPSGAAVSALRMPGDHCKGGMCSSDCSIPEGEYIRITKVAPVATWTVEVLGAPRRDRLAADFHNAHQLEVVASEPAVKLVVEGTLEPSRITSYEIFWPEVAADTEVSWTPRLVMEGPCPDERRCDPPATAKLEIRGVKPTGFARSK